MSTTQKLAAEFIGTFALIFVGVASICTGAGLVGIAIAHGLTIAVMVSAFGYISGGHFNPAVSFGLLVAGKLPAAQFVSYTAAQLTGAVAGAFAAATLLPPEMVHAGTLGTPLLGHGITAGQAIGFETLTTFFLVAVVFGTAVDPRAAKMGGLFIGLTVTLEILAGGAISGASLNPARTFGPALIGGHWQGHFVHWVGPLLGGSIAGVLYKAVFSKGS
jgi:MIP family channel proteins